MRVLMLGWEFPPYMSGGLGTACHGMAKALAGKGTEVIFVLPRMDGAAPPEPCLRLRSANNARFTDDRLYRALNAAARETWETRLTVRPIPSLLFPYATATAYAGHVAARTRRWQETCGTEARAPRSVTADIHGGYGPDLMSEVYRYSLAAAAIAQQEEFDVIHMHDWMTFPAGILAKRLTGKPLVAHVHATEHDRSGANANGEVAHIEWAGLTAADVVVAVSHYTKGLLERLYTIPESKIRVVHNAVSRTEARRVYDVPARCKQEKRVLFMGRVTFQKGPDYFVEAARLVLDRLKHVRFIMAGNGDMLPRMVRRVAQLRMGGRFHFTGFLKGHEVDRMYAISDLYVMPSVSEPFGIAPLEAMLYDVPVLISKQSGVSEVVRNALKVDFWDIQEMANKICAALAYPVLAAEIVKNCREELKTIRWENAANRLNALYAQLTQGGE